MGFCIDHSSVVLAVGTRFSGRCHCGEVKIRVNIWTVRQGETSLLYAVGSWGRGRTKAQFLVLVLPRFSLARPLSFVRPQLDYR